MSKDRRSGREQKKTKRIVKRARDVLCNVNTVIMMKKENESTMRSMAA